MRQAAVHTQSQATPGLAPLPARARLVRYAPAALLLLAVTPLVAMAQQRRTPPREAVQENGREDSPFEQEVQRLVQELLQRKRTSMALLGSLQELQLAMRSPSMAEPTRQRAEASLKQLRARLVSLESDGQRIQRRLSDICAAATPQGWVGIYYSADASANRDESGRLVMRFVDYPGIESVDPGSPADKAGIRGGDRMLAMAGRDLRDAEIDFTPLLKPGTRIPIKVRRGMETKILTVTVEPRPGDLAPPCPWIDERIAAAFAPMQLTVTVTTDEGPAAVAPGASRVVVQRAPVVANTIVGSASPVATVPPAPPAPPTPMTPVTPMASTAPLPPLPPVPGMGSASSVVFGGAQFVAVGPELAEALGVERGLLVVSAGRGSPAEQSGLRPGDVVLTVDGEPLTSPLVFLQALEGSNDRALRLQLLRRRKPMSLTLKW